MVKKIIHLSDIHIKTFKRHKEYSEIFDNLYNQIKDDISGYNYGEIKIVITGDIVHQKITVSNELIIFVQEFLNKLLELAPVIIIAGNHDLLEENKDRLDTLTPIVSNIKNDNLKYYKSTGCYPEDNVVWCVYSIFDGNSRPEIFKTKDLYPDKTYIGLYHGPVLNAKTSLGYEFKESGVGLNYFEGCDIVLLGDIHKFQSFEYINENGDKTILAYASSLIQQDFGEGIKNHGYLLWDVEKKTFQMREVKNDYVFFKFAITSLDDLDNEKEKLLNYE